MNEAPSSQDESFQRWLVQINPVCGDFGARALGNEFNGALQEHQRGVLRLSEVEVSQASLYRGARKESAGSNERFYAVFQLEGRCLLEQRRPAHPSWIGATSP